MEQIERHVPEDTPCVLVVDDEKVIREILADFLSMEGFWVRTAEDGNAALAELSRHCYDLVISDLKMPRMGGLELLEAVNKSDPNIVTVIMTGFGTVETAIDAMKKGAYDYILKPFRVEEVVRIVQRGLEKRRLAAENVRLREAISLYKVSEAIAQSLSLDEVFDTVLDTAMVESQADVVTVLVDDRDGSYVERSRRVRGEIQGRLHVGSLDINAILSHFEDNRPLRFHGPKADRFVQSSGNGPSVQSIVSIPMRIQGRTIGFLNAISYTEGRKFDEGQRKVMSILASRASAAIENARLYHDLKSTFQQTIHGLARALDKMDRYTAGHSDRVTQLGALIAGKLGLPQSEVDVVRQSGLMHDIGKIGVHANLNKPGKLSQAEYDVFKLHPVYGREILEPIKFLHPLIPGVHLHHERFDGHGYPLGIAGADIPLSARILAVADTYDAMTSDRAYRRALPHEVALAELARCSGLQFDPVCVEAFLSSIEGYRQAQRERDEGEKEG